MTEADALDKAQWLIDNWVIIVMVLAGSVGAYFRLPIVFNWFKNRVPGWVAAVKKAFTPNAVVVDPNGPPASDPEKPDVIVLINQMVESLPVIKDETLHKQAVEACVSFSEAVIREAGLVKSEEK